MSQRDLPTTKPKQTWDGIAREDWSAVEHVARRLDLYWRRTCGYQPDADHEITWRTFVDQAAVALSAMKEMPHADMWCPDAAAYDRGECCGKCPEFVRNAEAYSAAMRRAGEWLAKVRRQ